MDKVIARFGRYKVVEEIGRGAMGVVYKARDPKIDRWVALKTIRSSDGLSPTTRQEFLQRFYREAQTAGKLSHPAIVTIYDVGEEGEIPFIAMEYVDGRTLEDLLLEKGRLGWQEGILIVCQVAEALTYAHAHGIVHRDIKPANILLTREGRVKVTDFGIAKVAASQLTLDRPFLGTPSYMAPEQILGNPVDGRTDLFALGVVLYQLLTGVKPFSGEDITTICYKIVHEDPRPLITFPLDLPPGLDRFLAKALAKDPEGRFQTAREFAEALREAPTLTAGLSEETTLACDPEATLVRDLPKVTSPPRRPPWFLLWSLAAAGIGLLILLGLLLLKPSSQKPLGPSRPPSVPVEETVEPPPALSPSPETAKVPLRRSKAPTPRKPVEAPRSVKEEVVSPPPPPNPPPAPTPRPMKNPWEGIRIEKR